jgi:hypothetical protein
VEKRDWLLVALAYLAFIEVLSFSPVAPSFPCLVETPHSTQSANHNEPKYCTPFHSGIAVALERTDHFLEAHDKSVVGGFTIVLAISTIGLWLATNKLWAAGERQMELIAASGAQQSRDMQASIKAAEKGNELNRQAFIATHRPWIDIDSAASITGNLTISFEEGVGAALNLTLKNLGETPAENIFIYAEITFIGIVGTDYLILASETALARRPQTGGLVIFPKDTLEGAWEARVDQEGFLQGIARGPSGTVIHPVIVGCVTYDFGSEKIGCQTSFVFHVQMPSSPLGIPTAVGRVPNAQLHLVKLPITGVTS